MKEFFIHLLTGISVIWLAIGFVMFITVLSLITALSIQEAILGGFWGFVGCGVLLVLATYVLGRVLNG